MKKKLHFETIIDAPRREVWQTMLDRETFGQWTDAFMEGSHYEGSWETGSDIRFLAPDGSGGAEESLAAQTEGRMGR